jgi:hypothetical protein
MPTDINDPGVTAELAALHEEYEAALASNDVEKLIGFFWDSPHALRFGAGESLYGAREIDEFRKNRPAVDLARTNGKLTIVTFGSDCGIVTVEFDRTVQGVVRHGRQSQVWRKFDGGWKVVSAHVSFVPQTYADQAAAFTGLPIPAAYRDGVRINLERATVIAGPLLTFPLSDSTEAAPVFEP